MATRKRKTHSKATHTTKAKPKRRMMLAAVSASSAASADDFLPDSAAGFPTCAASQQERRAVLDHGLNGRWANEEIARLERVDEGGKCGWAMWRNLEGDIATDAR